MDIVYNKQISVIMPLYNAERYLKEALDSVLAQTFHDFELICINDTSTDHTVDILKEYQKKDNRIVILENRERMGAAEARNKGMSAAKGKYLVFLDGDDIFDEEMLHLQYKYAESRNLDIVLCEYMHVPSDDIYQKKTNNSLEKYYGKVFKVTQQDIAICTRLGMSPCNKLYRKVFIDSHHLQFQTLSCCNDVFFVSMAYYLAERISVLDDNRVMLYARDHFEISRISAHRDPMCYYWSMLKVGEELAKGNLLEKVSSYYHWQALSLLVAPFVRNVEKEMLPYYYDFLMSEGLNNIFAYDKAGSANARMIITQAIEESSRMRDEYSRDLSFFSVLLRQESIKSELADIIKEKEKGRQVVLWGAGKNGKLFIDFLEKNNLSISCVVDLNESKFGEKIGKYVIEDPKSGLCEGDIIIFTSFTIYEEMKENLEKKYDLFNIYEILMAQL